MARERAFKDQQVLEAANALLMEGKNVNGTSLRNKIGTGRPSALMSVYKELEAAGKILAPSLPDSSDHPVIPQELPVEVAEKLAVMLGDVEQLVHQINDHAHYIVEQRLNSAIAEANERAANAAKRESESIQEQDKAFEQLEDALEHISDLQEQIDRSQKEKSQLNAELSVAKNENKSAQDTILQQKAALTDMQDKLGTAETDKAKAQGLSESLGLQLSESKKEVLGAKAELSSLQQEYAKSEERNSALNKTVSSQVAEIKQVNQDLETAKTKASKFEALNESLNETIRVQKLEWEGMNSRLQDREKLVERLEGQVELQATAQEKLAIEKDELQGKLEQSNTALNQAQKQNSKLEGQLLQYTKSS